MIRRTFSDVCPDCVATQLVNQAKKSLATENTEITEGKQAAIKELRFTFWVNQQSMNKPFLSLCSL
jgi:hypothetical protein